MEINYSVDIIHLLVYVTARTTWCTEHEMMISLDSGVWSYNIIIVKVIFTIALIVLYYYFLTVSQVYNYCQSVTIGGWLLYLSMYTLNNNWIIFIYFLFQTTNAHLFLLLFIANQKCLIFYKKKLISAWVV